MKRNERGAAAVEFALVAPILIALALGTIEFGWAFYMQGATASAAREAAREFAIHNVAGDAAAAAANAGGPAGISAGDVSISPATCTPGADVTVSINHTYNSLTGFFGASFTATGKGVMRCGG